MIFFSFINCNINETNTESKSMKKINRKNSKSNMGRWENSLTNHIFLGETTLLVPEVYPMNTVSSSSFK